MDGFPDIIVLDFMVVFRFFKLWIYENMNISIFNKNKSREQVPGPLCLPWRAVTIHVFPKHLFTLEIDSQHLIIRKRDNPQLLMGQGKVSDRMSAEITK